MMSKKISLLCLLVLFVFLPVEAESIRGLLSDIIDLSDGNLENREFTLGLEELVAVIPGEKEAFLSGAELTLQIPQSIRTQADSFILLVYKRVSPHLMKISGVIKGWKRPISSFPTAPGSM